MRHRPSSAFALPAGSRFATSRAGAAGCGWPLRHLLQDAAGLTPGRQVGRALTVLLPAGLAAAAIFVLAPKATWIVFAFGWMLFPATGLLMAGLAGMTRTAGRDLAPIGQAVVDEVPRAVARRLAHSAAGDVLRVARAAATIGVAAAKAAEPEVRAALGPVALAALRVAAATVWRPRQAVWVQRRFLAPAAAAATAYAGLAAHPDVATDPELARLAADLPRVARLLHGLAQWLDAGGEEPDAPRTTGSVHGATVGTEVCIAVRR